MLRKMLLLLCILSPVFGVYQPYLLTDQETQKYGARCLDGSNFGFYYSLGSGTGATKLAFYLMGGGYCLINSPNTSLYENCSGRVNSFFGSSKYFPLTVPPAHDFLSQDSAINPDFYNWNMVELIYCSGDLWVGRNNVSYGSSGLYAAGHNNIVAVVETLKNYSIWQQLTEIIFTGDSAGGIGVNNNIDYIRRQAPPNAKVTAFPNAGWIMLHDKYPGTQTAPGTIEAPQLLGERVNPYIPEGCLTAYNNKLPDAYNCLWGNISFPYWGDVRSFIANSIYDSEQLMFQEGIPYYSNYSIDPSACNYVLQFGNEELETMRGPMNRSSYNTGIFAPAALTHVLEYKFSSNSTIPSSNGVNLANLFADWYFQRPNNIFPNYRAIDPCFFQTTQVGCNRNFPYELDPSLCPAGVPITTSTSSTSPLSTSEATSGSTVGSSTPTSASTSSTSSRSTSTSITSSDSDNRTSMASTHVFFGIVILICFILSWTK